MHSLQKMSFSVLLCGVLVTGCGRMPDLYAIMKILGKDKTVE